MIWENILFKAVEPAGILTLLEKRISLIGWLISNCLETKLGKKVLTYAFELINQKWKEIPILSLNVDRIRQIKCLGSKDEANDK
jgi:hypothetical protein